MRLSELIKETEDRKGSLSDDPRIFVYDTYEGGLLNVTKLQTEDGDIILEVQ